MPAIVIRVQNEDGGDQLLTKYSCEHIRPASAEYDDTISAAQMYCHVCGKKCGKWKKPGVRLIHSYVFDNGSFVECSLSDHSVFRIEAAIKELKASGVQRYVMSLLAPRKDKACMVFVYDAKPGETVEVPSCPHHQERVEGDVFCRKCGKEIAIKHEQVPGRIKVALGAPSGFREDREFVIDWDYVQAQIEAVRPHIISVHFE